MKFGRTLSQPMLAIVNRRIDKFLIKAIDFLLSL